MKYEQPGGKNGLNKQNMLIFYCIINEFINKLYAIGVIKRLALRI